MSWRRYLFGYLLDEWRLMRARYWFDGVYHNRPTPDVLKPEPPKPFTSAHPICMEVAKRQGQAGLRLKALGIKGPRTPISTLTWQERYYRFGGRA